MRNINYTVKPESSLKVAPIKKKDIHESLQEVNDSAAKLNEQMTELGTRFAAMQNGGVTSRLDTRSMELINNVLTQTKAMPGKVEKAVNTTLDKAIKRMDEKMSEMMKFCIAGTIIINGLWLMIALLT